MKRKLRINGNTLVNADDNSALYGTVYRERSANKICNLLFIPDLVVRVYSNQGLTSVHQGEHAELSCEGLLILELQNKKFIGVEADVSTGDIMINMFSLELVE